MLPKSSPLAILTAVMTVYFLSNENFAALPQNNEVAMSVRSAAEVIQKWKADQHLYVKGDLGVSAAQLNKLEQWLDENGPHWTIVLIENADDESFQALDQRKFHQMDAVEYALGFGLANEVDFGRQMNSETGETDGAVFVLFLVERKFSYYGSNIHDKRELGDANWIGELDRDAIRAMRNGGRIVDAVKDTVTSINSKLAAKLAAEKQAVSQAQALAERAVLERRRALDNLAKLLDESRNSSLPRLEESARQFRVAFPRAAESRLAQVPSEEWKTKIDNLKSDLGSISVDDTAPYQQSLEFRQVVDRTKQLRSEMDRLLDLYAAHKAFEDMLLPVEQRLDLIADHPNGAAIPAAAEAYQILSEARDLHARGEISFADKIQSASELTEQAEQAVKFEQQRLADEKNRRQLVRRTLSVAGSILAAIVVGLLGLLNFRRRPAMQRAHQIFERKSKIIESELAKLRPIFERCEQTLGSPTEFAAQKFSGVTQELGTQILNNVSLLNDMTHEAKAVVATAHRLFYPTNPLAEMANMFSRSRYDHGVNLLDGESLSLPPALAIGTDSQSQMPLESALMTFDHFFRKLRQTRQVTDQSLDTIAKGLEDVSPKIELLQTKLMEAIQQEQRMTLASRLDNYFRVPALSEKLLPAVQADYDQGLQLAVADPVQALATPIAKGLQKITCALAVSNTIQTARSQVFPQFELASRELKSLGFDIRWIERSVLQLSDRANQLIGAAVEQDIAPAAEQFNTDVIGLGLRAQRSRELATQINQRVTQALDQLAVEIEAARKAMAAELGIPENQVLRESGYSPDDELQQARQQLQSARASLNYGGVESALESLEVLEIESETARQWIAKTSAALQGFAVELAGLSQRQMNVSLQFPTLRDLIAETKSKFSETAWRILPVRAEHDNGQPVEREPSTDPSGTIEDYQVYAEELAKNVAVGCDQVQSLHSIGKALEAANLLQLLNGDLDDVENSWHGIKTHCQRLVDQAKANRVDFERCQQALKTLADSGRDLRTQRASIQKLSDLEAATMALQSVMNDPTKLPDPLFDQQQIANLNLDAAALSTLINTDQNAHAETSRAVAAAGTELATAQQSVFASANDRIPDSSLIKQCQSRIADLESQLKVIVGRLSVPHSDWRTVALDANRITSESAVVDGQLRRELELAQSAAENLETASQQVFDAASWNGPYGIAIVMKPGTEELERSRQLLSLGEYQESIKFSEAARYNANRAMQAAQRMVSDRQREIANAAADRRNSGPMFSFNLGSSGRSSDSRGSNSSSRSLWSSSSSRSSSFGGSSSTSQSSNGSSSSGFSRSGW